MISETLEWSDDCQTHHVHLTRINQRHASCRRQWEGPTDSSLKDADWTAPQMPISAAGTGRLHGLRMLHRGHVQATIANRQVCVSSSPRSDRICTCAPVVDSLKSSCVLWLCASNVQTIRTPSQGQQLCSLGQQLSPPGQQLSFLRQHGGMYCHQGCDKIRKTLGSDSL